MRTDRWPIPFITPATASAIAARGTPARATKWPRTAGSTASDRRTAFPAIWRSAVDKSLTAVFPWSESTRLRAGRSNPHRTVARTPFCKLAFDVALDAKNSPSGSAMALNRRPLALFLNSSASFPHRCRIFRQTSAGRAN